MAINMHSPPDPNPKNLPLYPGGTRAWSNPLFGCFSDFGTCRFPGSCSSRLGLTFSPSVIGLAATFCPCFLFSKINSRLNHLIYRGSPHPYGGDGRGHCVSYSCTWCFGIPCIMQVRLSLITGFRYWRSYSLPRRFNEGASVTATTSTVLFVATTSPPVVATFVTSSRGLVRSNSRRALSADRSIEFSFPIVYSPVLHRDRG